LELKKLSKYKYLFGLIGYPLSHSFSKKYFSEKISNEKIRDCYYELFPLKEIAEFPALLRKYPNLEGLNVTIPYKETVIPFLDKVDESAAQVGAVNTIKIESGKLFGYNSDVYGFEKALLQFLNKKQLNSIQNALILGTGGASKAVRFVLKKMELNCFLVSRNAKKGDFTYEDLDSKTLSDFQLIINTTPLGMVPKTDTFPALKYKQLSSNHFLFDLVYNPEKTVFLAKGEKQGCSILNGLSMLNLQAEKSWEIWNSVIDKN
jgi:shikimate dehydrogenase